MLSDFSRFLFLFNFVFFSLCLCSLFCFVTACVYSYVCWMWCGRKWDWCSRECEAQIICQYIHTALNTRHVELYELPKVFVGVCLGRFWFEWHSHFAHNMIVFISIHEIYRQHTIHYVIWAWVLRCIHIVWRCFCHIKHHFTFHAITISRIANESMLCASAIGGESLAIPNMRGWDGKTAEREEKQVENKWNQMKTEFLLMCSIITISGGSATCPDRHVDGEWLKLNDIWCRICVQWKWMNDTYTFPFSISLHILFRRQ